MRGRRPAGRRAPICDFMQKQHLDPLDVEFGILQVLDLFIFSQQNLEFGAAIQRAINDWQLAFWSHRDPRLKASILVGQDDAATGHRRDRALRRDRPNYIQINVCRAPTSRSAAAATGRSMHARRNWACRSAFTSAAMAATRRPAAAGRPIYAEEHQSNAHTIGGARSPASCSKASRNASRS